MRGNGIFGTLFKMAKPLIKKAGKFAVTSGSKYLGDTIGDIIDGKNIKTAIGNSNKKLAKVSSEISVCEQSVYFSSSV